jgi:hypothetical protein
MRRFKFGIVPLPIGDRNPLGDAAAHHNLYDTVIGISCSELNGGIPDFV